MVVTASKVSLSLANHNIALYQVTIHMYMHHVQNLLPVPVSNNLTLWCTDSSYLASIM